jgi:hypothetical protein
LIDDLRAGRNEEESLMTPSKSGTGLDRLHAAMAEFQKLVYDR